MSALAAQHPASLPNPESADLNTFPQPRPPTVHSRTPSPGSIRHPDLSNEVAALSTKLINAINHQTSLDDNLQASRHELEASRERIAQLEAAARSHANLLDQGLLVRRADSQKVEDGLRTEIAEERSRRGSAEKKSKGMELELETLTSALFEEANTMVAEARKDSDAAERKSDQLKIQLADAEQLLVSHQEQLHELKAVLLKMQSERDLQAAMAPSTPVKEKSREPLEDPGRLRRRPSTHNIPPENPLYYSHLICPMMRIDLQAYEDFTSLFRTSKQTSTPSRTPSGNFAGLNVMGLGPLSNNSQSAIISSQPMSQSYNASSLHTPSPNEPNILGSSVPNSPRDSISPADKILLKETKFYKRALVEDIEPTLRLDTAPGLSWLARRTVLNSMLAGNLIVEPLSTPPQAPSSTGLPPSSGRDPSTAIYTSKLQSSPAFPCALCGEQRQGPPYARRHLFRTSESNESAQRYPLCDYCVVRIRTTCDFVVFLRMAKSGHWSRSTHAGEGNRETQEDHERRLAWDESVRLRERMFWSRLGGGVIPVGSLPEEFSHSPNKARRSNESRPSMSVDEAEDAAIAMAVHQEQIDGYRLSLVRNPALVSGTIATPPEGLTNATPPEGLTNATPRSSVAEEPRNLPHGRPDQAYGSTSSAANPTISSPPSTVSQVTPPPPTPMDYETSSMSSTLLEPTNGTTNVDILPDGPDKFGRPRRRPRSSLLSRFQNADAAQAQPEADAPPHLPDERSNHDSRVSIPGSFD